MEGGIKILNVKNIDVYYGKVKALSEISFDVSEGEILSILGANGAGKTTLLKTISGLLKPKEGTIEFKKEKISGLKPDAIVKKGITQVPEGRLIFPRLTVLENLEMGAYIINDKSKIQRNLEWVYKMFPRLKERTKQEGGTLSGGEQQMLAIGRALMSNPSCLLLDEPSLGIAPHLTESIFETIQELNQNSNLTIMVVEQNAALAFEVSQRGIVLENGKVALEDSTDKLAENDEVKRAYLGM